MSRPSKYLPEYAETAYQQYLLGKTDKQLASLFGVSETTLNSWKKKFPEFLKSLRGKDRADGAVADALYKRCLGFEIEEKVYEDKQPVRVIKKQVLPDVGAITLWLKSRQPLLWREFSFASLTNEQLDYIIEKLKQQKPQSNE
jgi:hypothetical protein